MAVLLAVAAPAGVGAQGGNAATEESAQVPEKPVLNPGLGVLPEDYDATTPRRAWQGFQKAARDEAYLVAAHYLDLADIQEDQQTILGTDVARKLYRVLRHVGLPRSASLPDEVDPTPEEGQQPGSWLLSQFESRGVKGEVLLQRVSDTTSGQPRWLISKGSVAAAGGWAEGLFEKARKETTEETQARERGLNPGLPHPSHQLDRQTPRRALRTYIDLCRAGAYEDAAHLLWLNHVPVQRQATEGPKLARQLKIVLDQILWVDYESLSDEPFGKPELSPVPEDEDEFGHLTYKTARIPLRLKRVDQGDPDRSVWVLAPVTVQSIPRLYDEYGLGWLGVHMPVVLTGTRILEMELWQWLGLVVVALLATGLGMALRRVLLGAARFLSRHRLTGWDERIVEVMDGPLQGLVMVALAAAGTRLLRLALPAQAILDTGVRILAMLLVGWLLVRSVGLITDFVYSLMVRDLADVPLRRSIKTRMDIVRQLGMLIVGLLALSYVLMQFEAVRALGTGLLASAGVTGLVIGLAAQKTLANVFSGLQLGITQPVRVGDEVVFEDEWGWIEEITLTHVVIRIWDLRRLVVPIPYLLERPIQNWTRASSDILGTVYIHADYSVDVPALRDEVKAIIKGSDLWDGKVEPGLIVTDLKERTVELRALCSAANAGDAWNLRCHIREKALERMRELNPHWLPVTRVELRHEAPAGPES